MVETSERLSVGSLRASATARALPVVAFSVTMLVSAGLMFMVQPMFAKMILPLLGGTPAVWNTSMLFFQTALLLGYVYAHYSIKRLGVRRQIVVQVVLIGVSLLFLPIAVPGGWRPGGEDPALWLLALLTVALGLPFFVVSTMSPTLQRWFALLGHRSSRDPYFLYAASNLGSMVALLSYPLLVEPSLRLGDQSSLWSIGYVSFAVLTLGAAALTWRAASRGSSVETRKENEEERPTPGRRLRWLALAFVPSSLMLGVTTYLTTDIAAIPLLWVIPLALYLLSFILVFSPRRRLTIRVATRRLPLLLLGLVLVLAIKASGPVWLVVPLHLIAFFAAALVMHGRLSDDRPGVQNLTQFYLYLAAGGALGGLFNAIVAPLIFDSVLEYPLVIVIAALLMPSYSTDPIYWTKSWRDLALPGAVGGLSIIGTFLGPSIGLDPASTLGRVVLLGVPTCLCLSFDRRPVRFGLGIAALMAASTISIGSDSRLIFAERSFFGVHRVVDDAGSSHALIHGNTVHGRQNTEASIRQVPLTYYHRTGPLGDVFEYSMGISDKPNVGVIGLGTGSMACYSRPGERWTFYEIDPQVIKIARDPRLFSFLRDCDPEARIVVGDARLSLEHAPNHGYGLLVVDAFSSDSIPVHLVTREAIDMYRSKLSDGGVLMFHISNRYLDLRPVVANLAADAGMTAYLGSDLDVTQHLEADGKAASVWVAMAPDPTSLAPLEHEASTWKLLKPDPGVGLWTDDFSNVLGVLRVR